MAKANPHLNDYELLMNELALTDNNNGVSVNVSEENGNIVVDMDLAGVDLDNIDVSVEGNKLYINGYREDISEEEDRNYYMKEIHYGSFERVIPLPAKVDADSAEADFNDGVLTIILEKAKGASSKKAVPAKAVPAKAASAKTVSKAKTKQMGAKKETAKKTKKAAPAKAAPAKAASKESGAKSSQSATNKAHSKNGNAKAAPAAKAKTTKSAKNNNARNNAKKAEPAKTASKAASKSASVKAPQLAQSATNKRKLR